MNNVSSITALTIVLVVVVPQIAIGYYKITGASQNSYSKLPAKVQLEKVSQPLIALDPKKGDSRFYVSDFKADASYANYYCLKSGRKLLSIENPTKEREVEVFLDVYPKTTNLLWISANRLDSDGTWRWQNGTRVSYNNFYSPYDFSGRNCLLIVGRDQPVKAFRYKWLKQKCSYETEFICET